MKGWRREGWRHRSSGRLGGSLALPYPRFVWIKKSKRVWTILSKGKSRRCLDNWSKRTSTLRGPGMIRAVGDYLFSKNSLTTVLQSRIQEAARAVEACAEDYILGVSEDEYARHIASEVALEVPELGEPFMLEPTEIDFDVGHDPMWGGGQGHIRFVKGCRVVVRVPFSGYAQLFFCQPSTFGTLLPVAEVHRDCISFAYDQPGILNAQEVKAQFERDLELLKKNLGWIQSDCARYSQQLESEVRQRIANRRSRLAKNREIGLSI